MRGDVDPDASVELFHEDHVAVLGDSQWVLREESSRCGLRVDLMPWSLVLHRWESG